MKLAYIILAHKNVGQVVRLYERLNVPYSTFIIHVSKTSDQGFYDGMERAFWNKENVYFCKREDGTHNDFGIVKGIINALKLLIKKAIDFDYVNLLSGQDYPIKSSQEINAFFEQNSGKEFIKYWPMFPVENSAYYIDHPWGPTRQLYRIDRFHIKFCGKKHSIPELLTGRLIAHSFIKTLKIFMYESLMYWKEKRLKEEFLLFALSRLLPKNRKIPSDLEFFGGKTWWSFSKECATYIVKFYKYNWKFNYFFRFTLIPDEMYFQTLLMNSPFRDKMQNNYLREIEWEGGDGTHPIIFTKEHWQQIKESGAVFARKFDDAVDHEILDMIDQDLLDVNTTDNAYEHSN